MKITYEFDTNKEDFDAEELRRHQNVDNLCSCIFHIEEQLRNWYKWDTRGSIPIGEVHDKIFDIIDENHVFLDELWS